MSSNGGTDSSVEMAKYILPILVYIPIIIFFILFASFVGMKIRGLMNSPGGIIGYINGIFKQMFGVKDMISNFIKTFWPDKDDPSSSKGWKHIRIDTILIGLGGLFILIMLGSYNDGLLTWTKNKGMGGILYVLNPIMGFFAPGKWHEAKRNASYKQSQTSGGSVVKNYPLFFGGISLFLGFTILLSLLVNNFNEPVKTATSEFVGKKLLENTAHYLYLSIFSGVVLALFAGLLLYAATTDAAPKLLSTLLIILSVVIVSAAMISLFKKQINEFIQKPYMCRQNTCFWMKMLFLIIQIHDLL